MRKTRLFCAAHISEPITNFCCIFNCLKPLCPDCIDAHNKEHRARGQFPEVDTLERVQSMSRAKLDCLQRQLERQLARLRAAVELDVDALAETPLSELKRQREGLLVAVNAFFDELTRDVARSSLVRSPPPSEARPLQHRIEALLGEVESLREGLADPPNCEAIAAALRVDDAKLERTVAAEVEAVVDRCVALPFELVVVRDGFERVLAELRRAVAFERRDARVSLRAESPPLPIDDDQFERRQREWFAQKIVSRRV